MPNRERSALVAVLPLATALAVATGATAAPAAASTSTTPEAAAAAASPSSAPLAGGASVEGAPASTPGTRPAAPSSGFIVRVLDRQLTIASGDTVAVKARSTTVPIHAELRVGRHGRVVDRVDVAPNSYFQLAGSVVTGDRLWLRVRRTDGGAERSWTSIGAVRRMRAALASWYGPGLFGRRTACGQTLTAGLKGVAHKSLPCGTKLTVRYRGRSTSAVVIDRGPFSGSREFDLTQATARAIGFGAVGRVWVSHRA
ncbi:MAG: septal ring lytic transglycosylase RlpA family protein [Patulibacter minatonensis]